MPTTPGGLFDYVDAPYTDYAQGTSEHPTGVQEFQRQVELLLSGVIGPKVLSADATAVASNTLTAQSGLSQDVLSGIVYSFTTILWITATAGEGLQLNLAGGSAAMTFIKAAYEGYDGSSQALIGSATALATAISSQDAFSGWVKIHGSFQPSGDGTFAPKIAQTAHGSGSVQVLKGSSSVVQASA